MKKVVHFEVHFVILYSKTELLKIRSKLQFIDDYEARHLDRKAKKEELEYYDEKRRKTQQLSLF